MNPIKTCDQLMQALAKFIPDWTIGLIARLAIFMVFWTSAQTKIAGFSVLGQNLEFWKVTESTVTLFEYEYALPLIPANIAAYMATIGEFFFALFLLFGLFTRISALGLLIMTLVIQIFVFPGLWATHLLWVASLIYLFLKGGGSIALDALLGAKN